MAYSYEVFNHSGSGSYAGEEYSWSDKLTIEETAASPTGATMRVRRESMGNNTNVQATTVTFTCEGQTLSHEFPYHYVPSYYVLQFTDDWEVEFPISWVDKTVSFRASSGSYSGSFVFNGYGGFKLTIATNDKLPLTVERTSSPKAGAGTGSIASGADIYSDDVLKVTFSLAPGYKGEVKLNDDVIASGATHTVSSDVAVVSAAEPMATLHIWNGQSWDMYLIYVRGSASWDLHQVNIYDGNAWQKYF